MFDCFCFNPVQLLKQFLIRRFLSPHFWLIISSIFFIIFGSWMFMILEGKNLQLVRDNTIKNVNGVQDKYMDVVWKKAIEKKGRNIEEAVKEIIAETKAEFGQYVDTVHTAQRTLRHGSLDGAPSWDFKNSLIFTATMLTSIGYGYVVPITNSGRLFVVIFCLIGIPLTLLTVANIAKFISETVFLFHYEMYKVFIRWKQRGKEPVVDSQDLFHDSEDEQDLLDRVQLVRFPPLVVFLFVVLYGLIGAAIINRNEPDHWSYTDSLYFTFISILTVGFGDMHPSGSNRWDVALVVTGGIILTTMCMDVVGRMYLKEIHYLGRKLQTNNPFYLIREAKARRRRQAMASLLAQLAKGMIFAHKNYNELSRKKSKVKERRHRGSHVLPDGKFMFARLPPDPPSDCMVVSTSAYSVRLAWAPAFSTDAPVTYNIRYRLKYSQQKGDNKVRELKGIQGNAAEIMSLDSCSLYEFRITAVSKNGESKAVVLVQYTEPQLSPQHILATKLHANTIELTWEPPYKRTGDVKNYMVYWTDNPSARLADWEKVTVYGRKVVFPDLKYDWFYMFSANACFMDGQRSPLSRALFVKTEKLEFNRLYVGHSKTVEVMEALKEDEYDETTPLLKRDYASFAV